MAITYRSLKSQAGLNSYKISVKEWVEKTNDAVTTIDLTAFPRNVADQSCKEFVL